MEENILKLIESNGGIFWRDFMRLMVSGDAEEIFAKLRDIYAHSADEADAKARLRSLAEGLA